MLVDFSSFFLWMFYALKIKLRFLAAKVVEHGIDEMLSSLSF